MASKMAARVGVEPTRRGSKPRVLPLDYRAILERHMGLEPTTSAWKANMLPLHQWRINAGKDLHLT